MNDIIKVQISLFTSGGDIEMMSYNKDMSIFFSGEATKEVIKAVGKNKKAYFYYHIANNRIILGKKAPAQDW